MTDAPERIWAWAWGAEPDTGHWEIGQNSFGDGIEYHRADLTALAVAAALQGAADKVSAHRAHLNYHAMLQLLRDDPLPEPVVTAVSKLLDGIANSIRAQIDPTGLAALEAYAAKVRAEALEEAAAHCDKVAETTHDDVYWGVSPDREVEKRIAKALAAAIRAMAQPTAKEGGAS